MSGGDIKLSISGGNINIGNLSQGDGNQLQSGQQSIHAEAEQAFASAFAQLEEYRQEQRETADITALQAELQTLKQQLTQQAEPSNSLIDKAKSLYEKYNWAGDILQKLYKVALPMLAL